MLILLGSNATPRPNMDAAIGAEFNMTTDHVTEGSIEVKIPTTETAPQECDRFYITELDPAFADAFYTVTPTDLTGTWEQIADKLLTGAIGYHAAQSYFYKYQIILGANGYDVTKDIATSITAGSIIRMPRIIFSGTVMEVEQEDAGSDPALSYKLFKLTLASAARCLTRVYCDIKIPSGANVTQILYGNDPAYPWYSSAIANFPGLFKTRILPEGFDSRTFNDTWSLLPERFDGTTLDGAANLWGLTVAEVLDTLATNAGAVWTIDEWDTFAFVLDRHDETAPFDLDTNANVFNFKPTRDSFTTYSAVRVVGGSGPTTPTTAICRSRQRDNFKTNTLEIIDDTHAALQFSFYTYHQFGTNDPATQPYTGHYVIWLPWEGSTPGEYVGWEMVPLFIEGIESAPTSGPAATVAEGGQTVTMINGFKWRPVQGYEFAQPNQMPATVPTTPNPPVIYLDYVPSVPIVTRLIDPTLQGEVKEQAGGTGVIEYVYKDDSIKTFTQAATTASNLLQTVTKRTVSVEFSTFVPGFKTGQMLSGDLPYYGISDNYLITAVKTVLERAKDTGEAVWRYDVSASTAAYRDALKGLFYTPTVSSFKLGQDFPAADGVFVQSGVGFGGGLWAYACDPWTWTQLAAQGRSWNAIAALGYTWDAWLNRSEVTNYGTHDGLISRITDDGAAVLLSMLAGNLIPSSGQYDLTHHIRIEDPDTAATEIYHLPSKDPAFFSDSDRLISQFIFAPAAGYHFTKCYVETSSGTDVAEFPIDIDTRPGAAFNGHKACIYIMWQPYSTVSGIGGNLTSFMKDALAVAIRNPVFGVRQSLYTGRFIDVYRQTINEDESLTNYENRIYNVTWLFIIYNVGDTHSSWFNPVAAPTVQGRSLITIYFVPPSEKYVFAHANSGNPFLQGPIPFNVDKSDASPLGEYTLTIVKKDVAI